MSVSPANEKALQANESSLAKIVAAVKKVIAKEFLWILVCIIVSIPLAFLIDLLIVSCAADEIKTTIKTITGAQGTFVGAYLIGFAGLYFSRLVKGAIETQFKAIASK